MKKLLSLVLTLVLVCSLIPAAYAAEDDATQAAQTLYELGLFKGTGTNRDGTPVFDLKKTPTRNQAIIMLVRLLGKEEEALAGEWELPFTDVPKTSTAYPYIGYAYANGLTGGTSATTYSGGNPIRANQYITFVLRAMGYVSGEDFEVSTAWEFSDEIGLTDGTYSAATKTFTRGDVARISCAALDVCPKGSEQTLLEKLLEENAVGPNSFKAWYEVDEKGALTVKTDYDIFHKEGYWVLIDKTYQDGSRGHDSQSGYSVPAEYRATSSLTHGKENRRVTMSISLYKNAAEREQFWDLWEEKNSKEAALAAFEDRLLMRAKIEDPIVIEQLDESFSVTAFSLRRNEATQEETYTAQISEPIRAYGEYGLVYEGHTGEQYAGLTYIGRGKDCLTYTREIDHFATKGASGRFFITHNFYEKQDDGAIVCKVSRSSGIDYTIQ